MIKIITLNWIIGGVATLLMAYAIFVFLKSLKILARDLNSALKYLVSSLVFYLFMGLGTGIFAAKDIHYSEVIWVIIPSFSLIGSFLFVCGAKKLTRVLQTVSGGKKEGNRFTENKKKGLAK
jgi:hypothetical protein